MLNFVTKHGYKGFIAKEGFFWWKKWRVYLVVEEHYKMLDELPGSKSLQDVIDYLKSKYPEILF